MNRENLQNLVSNPVRITGFEPFQYEGLNYEIGWQLTHRNYIARDSKTQKLVNILFFTPDEISYNNVVSRFDLYSTIKQNTCFKKPEINKYLTIPLAWGILTQGSSDLTMFIQATTPSSLGGDDDDDNNGNEDLSLYPQVAFIILPYIYTYEVDVKQIGTTSLSLFLYQMLTFLDNLQTCGYGLSTLDLSSIAFDTITTSYIVVNTQYITNFSQGQVETNILTLNNIHKEIMGTVIVNKEVPNKITSYSELRKHVIDQYFLSIKKPLIQKHGNELFFFYPDDDVTVVYSLSAKQFLSVINQNFQQRFKLPTDLLLPEINTVFYNYEHNIGRTLSPQTSVKNLYILQQLYQAYYTSADNTSSPEFNSSLVKKQACDALNLYNIVVCHDPKPIKLNSILWLYPYPEDLIEYYFQIQSLIHNTHSE